MPAMRFPLPEVIDPPGYRELCLHIPDEPMHVAAFWGNLLALCKWSSWSKDAAHTATEVAAVWRRLYGQARQRWENGEGCCGEADDGHCYTFHVSSPSFVWSPFDPHFSIPVPPLTPVFQVAGGIPALGIEQGDVLAVLSGFDPQLPPDPPPDPPTDPLYARFTWEQAGESVVEVHLLQIPFGGLVAIDIDDDPLSLQIFDLSRDLPETGTFVSENSLELSVAGYGRHFIDIAFIPNPKLEPPLFFFGGGIRKVVVCGDDIKGFDMPPQLRVENCILQYRYSDTQDWIDVPGDYDLCPPEGPAGPVGPVGPAGPVGQDGPDSLDPGDPVDTASPGYKCAVCNEIADMVIATYNDTLDAADGQSSVFVAAAGVAALFGAGGLILAGAMLVVATLRQLDTVALRASVNDPDFRSEFVCALFCSSLGDDCIITKEMLAEWVTLVAALDYLCAPTLSELMQSISKNEYRLAALRVSGESVECEICDCYQWTHVFDFTQGAQGWVTDYPTYTEYASGAWRGKPFAVKSVFCAIRIVSDNFTMTGLRIVGFDSKPELQLSRGFAPSGAALQPVTVNMPAWQASSGVFDVSWEGIVNCVGGLTVAGGGDDMAPSPAEYITRIEVSGVGPNPFS